MKNIILKISQTAFILTGVLVSTQLLAGNPDRAGSAGGQSLLINSFAKSSGLGESNMANVTGIESISLNIAGLAFTKKTEVVFARSIWLRGSGVNINTLGFSQKMGNSGVLGISIESYNLGEIDVTTVNQPEGGIGTFTPSYLNIGISYAKQFSNSISGGLAVKLLSEQIPDVSTQGVVFDAGVRYATGEKQRIKFGVSLKNVGPTMRYKGDGLSIRITNEQESTQAVQQRSANIELPSLINVGASYDFFLAEKHTLTASGNFRSNSFTKDQIGLGAEYNFNEILYLRTGFLHEKDIFSSENRTTAYTGPSFGMSLQAPLGKNAGKISIDYSYRTTTSFDGTHTIGARINL